MEAQIVEGKLYLKAENAAEQMHNKNYKATRNSYNSVCGIHNGGDKVWLLDVDHKNEFMTAAMIIRINSLQPIGDKVLSIIPSRQGCHVITKGFDLRGFSFDYPDVEIHKNNPTNLYIP